MPGPKGIDLGKVGSQLDVIDSRVAAAVTVAREANTAGKPTVVESELSVASSFLPKPTEGDLAYARQRSEKATPADYEAQRKKAAEKQAKAALAMPANEPGFRNLILNQRVEMASPFVSRRRRTSSRRHGSASRERRG